MLVPDALVCQYQVSPVGGVPFRVRVVYRQYWVVLNVPVGVAKVALIVTLRVLITVLRFLKVSVPVPHVEDHVTVQELEVPE